MTTRIGILSDIHGDIRALRAALQSLRTELACDQILCAGDLVDGDPFADEVVALLAAMKIPTVRGNHDRWALEHAGLLPSLRRPESRRAPDLSPASLQYLQALPTNLAFQIEGVRLLLTHARPGSDMDGIHRDDPSPERLERMLADRSCDVLVVGHTHEAWARPTSGGLVVNPGSIYGSAPTGGVIDRSHDRRTFATLDLPSRRFEIHHLTAGWER